MSKPAPKADKGDDGLEDEDETNDECESCDCPAQDAEECPIEPPPECPTSEKLPGYNQPTTGGTAKGSKCHIPFVYHGKKVAFQCLNMDIEIIVNNVSNQFQINFNSMSV